MDKRHKQATLNFEPSNLELQRNRGPVECLGMTFSNDEERRDYFLKKLREGLEELHAKLGGVPFTTVEDAVERMKSVEKWPIGDDARLRELSERMRHADSSKDLLQRWKDEVGFPHGEIEDILNLSDPPYYTACPNPFIADFIKHYGKPYDPNVPYSKEPFAADVSEGKNDPIYNAHSYHTKVPHKAIMRYILHYTEPGDVVFDGFCGTGMTGVAAQLCADREKINALGYKVLDDGTILNEDGERISTIGSRKALVCDLSPLATFVASRYNDFISIQISDPDVTEYLEKLESQWRQLYRTVDPDSGAAGEADFYVWSEVFSCPHCAHQTTLFEFAVDESTYKLRSNFLCPSCHSDLRKEDLDRVWENRLDLDGKSLLQEAKSELVEVAARFSSGSRRYRATDFDLNIIRNIRQSDYAWVPPDAFPLGRQTRKVKSGSGIAKVFQMFTPRALVIISHAWERVRAIPDPQARMATLFLLSSALTLLSRRERYRDGTGKGAQSGTLYVPSLQIEKNAFHVLRRKQESFCRLALRTRKNNCVVSCQSHAALANIPENTVDYIFTDPPFGESLQYGELNFFHESWFRVLTRLEDDCVLNYVHQKDLGFYQDLMRRSFEEAYRILKPGRWITVEFHNSQNSVWMAIQEALWRAGFTVADVRVLDKKQGTFNVVNRAGAVKQDLVISAYKPNGGLEERFKLTAGTEEGVWDFIRTHLRQLPVFVAKKGQAEVISYGNLKLTH